MGTLNIYWCVCAAAHQNRGFLGTGTTPKRGLLGMGTTQMGGGGRRHGLKSKGGGVVLGTGISRKGGGGG